MVGSRTGRCYAHLDDVSHLRLAVPSGGDPRPERPPLAELHHQVHALRVLVHLRKRDTFVTPPPPRDPQA
eukprot:8825138-Pyramimonas_sp.AAC.1